MTFDELLTAEPTLSQNNSKALFYEICHQHWRCYSSALTEEVTQLTERFLRSHARIPGVVTEQMLATLPMEVFRYTTDAQLKVFGALFINGAVAMVVPADLPGVQLLFVSDSTAAEWNYPDEGYLYMEGHGGTE